MTPTISRTGDHEVAQAVLRRAYKPRERVSLSGSPHAEAPWTVLECAQDPHGWKIIAVRCLPDCRGHRIVGE
ncbi:MAG TPA: hypothetical protein VEG84_08045 [Thermoanaerobaculia bacterium]|nr:hypothetical protein [Thermoanaerobaculia bacterium]